MQATELSEKRLIREKIAELQERGFCVLKKHFPEPLIMECQEAFWPTLLDYLHSHRNSPNRGPHRHFLPMSFEPPCFLPEFFFDQDVLKIVHGMMDKQIVADQWGCDVPLSGSDYQKFHSDYKHPLFSEFPDLLFPPYFLIVSFGLVPITPSSGPVEIVPGTHLLPRSEMLRLMESDSLEGETIPLEIGDVLIRHPWALHRGTPNKTEIPRALATVRYVRRWYFDDSREVSTIPFQVWESLEPEQRDAMRFPRN